MGFVRIIAGSLRGRRIRVPPGGRVRPTGDRVREALFDILGPTLNGTSVLDAFAGSGALGLETLSRGAASVTFLEKDRRSLAAIERSALDLGVRDRCVLLSGTTDRLVGSPLPGAPFDLVLADPPYEDPVRTRFLRDLVEGGLLAAAARVVVERDRRTPPIAQGLGPLVLERSARYGRACLDFYRWTGGRPRASAPFPESASGKGAG